MNANKLGVYECVYTAQLGQLTKELDNVQEWLDRHNTDRASQSAHLPVERCDTELLRIEAWLEGHGDDFADLLFKQNLDRLGPDEGKRRDSVRPTKIAGDAAPEIERSIIPTDT